MAYRIQKGNIRKPRRRRQTTRRRSVRKAPRRRTSTRRQMSKKNDCICPGELSPSAKFALAQLDPFEPKCLGAKVPDTNTMPSIANADTDQVTLPGPATTGNLIAIAFNPSYYSSVLAATEVSSSAVAWGTTFSQRRNYSNVVASVEAIRAVAHAVRMVSPLAPTSTTGFVHVGIAVESRVNSSAGTAPDYPTTVNQMTGLAHYKRFTLASLTQSPVTIINKWIDESAFRYDDPRTQYAFAGSASTTNPTTFQFQSSWGTLIVMVEGQPSTATTPISFEHLLLTECLPRKDAWVLGTQAAPNSPGTMSAVSVMTSETDFAHTEAQQDTYIQEGLRAFERGASVAGERVWNDVAAPLLTRFGNAVVNTGVAMAFNAISGRGGIPGVNSNPGRLALT